MFKGGKIRKGQQLMEEGNKSLEEKKYEKAKQLFKKANEIFSKAKDRKLSDSAEAYLRMSQGYHSRNQGNYLEAMKSFGKAIMLLSRYQGFDEEITDCRLEQAESQIDFAKQKAIDGEFLESARLYEAAGAVFQMIGLEKEAAGARARSFVQRAALVDDDFEKARFLEKSVEEFRKARENVQRIEGHAYFYKGRSLINVRIKEAISLLDRASAKYEKAGAMEQVTKVRQLLEQVVKDAKLGKFREEHRRR
jgi:tetratricopeptide (TPR) repeat protein